MGGWELGMLSAFSKKSTWNPGLKEHSNSLPEIIKITQIPDEELSVHQWTRTDYAHRQTIWRLKPSNQLIKLWCIIIIPGCEEASLLLQHHNPQYFNKARHYVETFLSLPDRGQYYCFIRLCDWDRVRLWCTRGLQHVWVGWLREILLFQSFIPNASVFGHRSFQSCFQPATSIDSCDLDDLGCNCSAFSLESRWATLVSKLCSHHKAITRNHRWYKVSYTFKLLEKILSHSNLYLHGLEKRLWRHNFTARGQPTQRSLKGQRCDDIQCSNKNQRAFNQKAVNRDSHNFVVE